jgi:hypothetical protein
MPHVLVAAYVWGDRYVDVVNMRGADRVTAARLPQHDGLDIFAPHEVVWHYMGAIEPAVAALLRLPRPDHPDAPTTAYPAPLTLFVSSQELRPMSPTRQGRSACRWRDGTSEPDVSTSIASVCVVSVGRAAARYQSGGPACGAGCADALLVWRDLSSGS